jgi:hypothetical protein
MAMATVASTGGDRAGQLGVQTEELGSAGAELGACT